MTEAQNPVSVQLPDDDAPCGLTKRDLRSLCEPRVPAHFLQTNPTPYSLLVGALNARAQEIEEAFEAKERAAKLWRANEYLLYIYKLLGVDAESESERHAQARRILAAQGHTPPTELIAASAPIEAPPDCVSGLIPKGAVCVIRGSYKSWLAMDLMAAVASGGAWLDSFSCRAGSAALVDYQNGAAECGRRLKLLARNQDTLDRIQYTSWPTEPGERLVRRLASKYDLVVIDDLTGADPRGINNPAVLQERLFELAALGGQTGCAFVVTLPTIAGWQSPAATTIVSVGMRIAKASDELIASISSRVRLRRIELPITLTHTLTPESVRFGRTGA